MEDPLHIVSFSGGKDSTAMLLRMLELKMPVDVALFADTKKEFRAMYDYHKLFRSYMAENHPEVEMMTVTTPTTWDHWFHGKLKRGKRIGATRGWPLLCFPCWWSREAKFKPLDAECKGNIRYIGYAADEKRRLAGDAIKSEGYKAPLGEWGWTEKDCLEYLESRGLAVQLHRDFNRTGCYLCPKQPRKSLEIVCEKYPEEWEAMRALEDSNPTPFNPKHTLKEIEDAVHDRMLTPPKEVDLTKIIENAKECDCDSDWLF